jgi:hypothetical protein
MSGMSDYLEGKLIDHIFRTASYTKPTGLWVGLFTAAPTDAGGGTEVTGGNYSRAVVGAPADATWAAPSGNNGTTNNSNIVTFPVPNASWGLITHWAIFDALSGGNILFYGALAANKNVNNGDPAPTIPVSSLTVQIDN